jgi:uncharacterized protein YndB with AHSA1/START domain
MKPSILAAGLCLVIVGHALADSKYPDVVDTSFNTPDGARTLQQSIVIDAPVATLWKSFTDPEEFKRWNSPVAAIDMRVGGSMEVSYNPKAALGDPDNIKHRVITFLPERLIVFQNTQAPHQLQNADRFQRTVSVIQYEPLGPAKTRVTLSCTGWAADPASMQLYHFFETENPEVLEKWKHLYEAQPKAP